MALVGYRTSPCSELDTHRQRERERESIEQCAAVYCISSATVVLGCSVEKRWGNSTGNSLHHPSTVDYSAKSEDSLLRHWVNGSLKDTAALLI